MNTLKGLLGILFISAFIISSVTPPFQSPDEFVHFERAYLLSDGVILANDTRAIDSKNSVTGGLIDKNLLAFMNIYEGLRFDFKNKWDPIQESTAKSLFFTDQKEWSPLPGSAVYFPLIYLPQATAIKLGQVAHLNILNTYNLAKLFSLITALLLIYLSGFFYQIPLFALSLLFFPMSLFQLSAASMDKVAFGLIFFVASLLARGLNKNKSFSISHLIWLILSFTILVSARVQLMPLYLIIFLISYVRKNPLLKISSAISLILTIVWNLWAHENVKGFNTRSVPTMDFIKIYLADPLSFINVFTSTWLSKDHWGNVVREFIGNLGWLDTPLGDIVYFILITTWIVFIYQNKEILFSYFHQIKKRNKNEFLLNLTYLFSLFLSIFLMYFILLLTFTQQPAKLIEGIQGRYFIPYGILFFYFGTYLNDTSDTEDRINKKSLYTLAALSTIVSVYVLMARYYGI